MAVFEILIFFLAHNVSLNTSFKLRKSIKIMLSLAYTEMNQTNHRIPKIVSMIRKYQITNPWHDEDEPLNHHETPGRQIKQSNQLSRLHQDDYNTRMDIKLRTTKH